MIEFRLDTDENELPKTSDIIMKQLYRHPSSEEIAAHHVACRICLSIEGEMITPCNCKGSIQKVHQNCLQRWILNGKTYDCYTYETEKQVKCEICHYLITFYLYKKKKCGLQNLQKNWKYQKVFLIIHILLILLFIVSISLMVKAICDTTRRSGNLQMQEPTFIAVSTLCGILTFFLGGLVYRLIIQNFIYMKFIISRVMPFQNSKQVNQIV